MTALALFMTVAPGLSQPWQPQEYPISYWVGPPVTHNTLEAWQRVRDCNFTVAGPYWGYSVEENKKMLDFCQQVGVRVLIMDSRINWQMVSDDNWRDTISKVIADYGAHPATYGYYLQDEPNYRLFRALGQISQEFQRQDPAHLPYINLFPTYASVEQLGNPTYADHLDKFLSIVRPAVLSYDHYCLRADGTNTQEYFENMGLIRAYGLRYGVPTWNIIQSCSYHPSMRDPSDVDMRWQVYTSLAYGIKGLMYFTYWNAVVDKEGKPARLYPVLQQLNSEIKALGRVLLGLTSTGVFHTGPTPPGAARLGVREIVRLPNDVPLVVGFFHAADATEYVMIANNQYTEPVSFEATFLPHVTAVAEVSRADGSEMPLELTGHKLPLTLPPGDGKLLRLTTQFTYPEPAEPVKTINFQFDKDGDAEGWGDVNSLSAPRVQNGVMSLTVTGEDPFLVRTFVRLQPDQYSRIKVRMKLPPCNNEGQFFWTTSESPGFADDKYVNFPVIPDGEWHEYEIPVGTHDKWRGKAVRAIRLDPTTGGAQPGSTIEIDWIVGE